VALAFLIIVFLFVIALIALFVFPPQKWVEFLHGRNKKP
jgi:hypothetical protein